MKHDVPYFNLKWSKAALWSTAGINCLGVALNRGIAYYMMDDRAGKPAELLHKEAAERFGEALQELQKTANIDLFVISYKPVSERVARKKIALAKGDI